MRLGVNRTFHLSLFCGWVLVCFLSLPVRSENWTRYRGDNGTGISNATEVPTRWSPGDYLWSRDLPGLGHSSPVIFEDRLFVTSAVDEGAIRYLYCLNAKSGKEIWARQLGMNRSHKHSKSSWASSTPVTDGHAVYVALADKERLLLSSYDYAGTLIWRRSLGRFSSQHGHGVSPILYKDLIILPNDQKGPSSVVALDKATGQTRWSALRSVRRTSYSTPFVLARPGTEPQLICVSGASGVTSLKPETGDVNWFTGEFPLRTVASPVYGGGLITATCGGGGVGKLLIAIDPNGKGAVADTHVKYRIDRNLPYVPTPVVYQDHIYLWNDNGVVRCLDVRTGKNLWTQRIGGNYSGSPICISGRLYCMSEAGDVVVLAASPKFQQLATNPLGDGSHSTPAVAQGQLYLRTFHKLFCIGKSE
ncbi:MAG: PQQ-binding-like beta-propeller repeat protein [Planctomycetaceae bacterium]